MVLALTLTVKVHLFQYREVTQKIKRKTLALGTSIADVFKRVRNLNIPAISQSLRRDYVTAVSAEFCTLQFDKKLSRTRQIIELFFGELSAVLPCVGRAAETRVSFLKII